MSNERIGIVQELSSNIIQLVNQNAQSHHDFERLAFLEAEKHAKALTSTQQLVNDIQRLTNVDTVTPLTSSEQLIKDIKDIQQLNHPPDDLTKAEMLAVIAQESTILYFKDLLSVENVVKNATKKAEEGCMEYLITINNIVALTNLNGEETNPITILYKSIYNRFLNEMTSLGFVVVTNVTRDSINIYFPPNTHTGNYLLKKYMGKW